MCESDKISSRNFLDEYSCRVCGTAAVGGSLDGDLAWCECKIFNRSGVRPIQPYVGVNGQGKCTTKHTDTFAAEWCRACRLEKRQSVGMKRTAPSQSLEGKYTGSVMDHHRQPDKDVPRSSESSTQLNGNFTPDRNSSSGWDTDMIPATQADAVRPTGDRPDVNYVSSYCDLRPTPLAADVVARAVKITFSDQIERWTEFKRLRERRTDCPVFLTSCYCRPERVVNIISHHCLGIVLRLNKFLSLLPGMDGSNPEVVFCVTIGWKWLACALIHHASFMSNHNAFWTVGSTEFHYSRYWQDIISDKAFVEFTYRFCSLFRDIGLTEIERYVLMAVIFVQPAAQETSFQPSTVSPVHRHYTGLLSTLIEQRCSRSDDVHAVNRKLECFFDALHDLRDLQQFYFADPDCQTPFDTVKAAKQFRIIQSEMRSNAMNDKLLHEQLN